MPQAAVEFLDNYISLARATSDAEGMARFRIPADAQVSWVVALKPGLGLDCFENYKTWPTTRVKPLPATPELILGDARTVRVKLIGSDDRPVPGLEVATGGFQKKRKIAAANISGGTIARVKTDVEGVATFDFVPADLEGGFSFSCTSGDYDFKKQIWYDPASGVTELTARVLRTTRVSGKVTLPDGKPAAGIPIQAEGYGESDTYCRRFGRSAADGSYSLEVDPDQDYIIAVVDESWARITSSRSWTSRGLPPATSGSPCTRGNRARDWISTSGRGRSSGAESRPLPTTSRWRTRL